MKNCAFSIGVFLVTFFSVQGQQEPGWRLNVSGSLMSDFQTLSVFSDYSDPFGVGLSLVKVNPKGGGWFVKYTKTQSHSSFKPRSVDYEEITNPGYEVYSNNHLNHNAIMVGFHKIFNPEKNFTGTLKCGVGPNLSNFSAINGVSRSTNEVITLEKPTYYLGFMSELSGGFLCRINDRLYFSSELFTNLILQHYYQNTFLDLSAFIGISFGIMATL